MTEQIILAWIKETCDAYCIPKPLAIIETLEAARATAEQSRSDAWISVDERLPKACTEVLVWRIDSGPFIAQLVAPCDVPDADDESEDLRWLADAYGWQEGSEKPTYWKPLPEGPIVESQQDAAISATEKTS